MADGYLGKCKECCKKESTINRRKKEEYYLEYDNSRSKLSHRVKQRIEYQTKTRKENPEKYKARTAVHNALRSGKLLKSSCEICGKEKVEAHHEDYTKPLSVRWLCSLHHGHEHRVV